MNDMPRKFIWIIAGETSGDGYGAAVARELRRQDSTVTVRGMGGDRMRAAGVDTFVDSSELDIIGIVECLKKLFFFIRLLKRVESLAKEERPSTVVLIDYPGFNLQLAKRLHRLGIRIVWYVSPQVWAWKRGRIWKLAKYCDRMLCIFPFEPDCYAPTTLKAEFVGHPLLDILRPWREAAVERREDLVLLLPGSRRQELRQLLPDFVQAATILHRAHPELHFHFALPRPAILEYAKDIFGKISLPADAPEFQWSCGDTRQRMREGVCAIAASGTVTVESALLGLPVVVAYRTNPLTWWIARRLVKLTTITIANLVCGKTVFEERLQDECSGKNLAECAEKLLSGGCRRQEVLRDMADFEERLGAAGDVSCNVARIALTKS